MLGGGGKTSTPGKEIPAGWREHKLKYPRGRGGWGGGFVYFLNYIFRVYIWQVIIFKCSID